jgi:predicted MFS family arabinose efflux permease
VTDAPSRWRPVLAYAALSAVNQMLWLTYTPLTTGAARHYHVSSGAIGWLAELFPLLYVVLAVPAGRLIDRRMPVWLGIGAALTAAGGLLRLVGDDYPMALAGQVLVAVAQPLVLNAVTTVSARYLRERDRPTGIAVSSAGIFAGMVLALVLGAALGSGRIGPLLVVQAVLGVGAALGLGLALRAPARTGSARSIRRLTGLVCVGFGVFIALTTWLQTLLEPAGVSDSAAGYLLLAMVVSGVAGSAVLPPVLARRGSEGIFVLVSVVAACAALVVLAVVPGVWTGLLVLLGLGFLLLTDLPVILGLAERRAGASGGTASALLWLAGNAAGLVAAVVVQLLVHHPAAAFAVLAAMLALGLPLARSLGDAGGAVQPVPAPMSSDSA